MPAQNLSGYPRHISNLCAAQKLDLCSTLLSCWPVIFLLFFPVTPGKEREKTSHLGARAPSCPMARYFLSVGRYDSSLFSFLIDSMGYGFHLTRLAIRFRGALNAEILFFVATSSVGNTSFYTGTGASGSTNPPHAEHHPARFGLAYERHPG